MMKLPFNKRIVVRIIWSGYEGSPPITIQSKLWQILLPHWCKIVNPMQILCKFRNFLIFNFHLLQNIVLIYLFIIRKFWREAIFFKFIFYFICCGFDRHSCAMESLAKQNIVSLYLFKSRCKFWFADRKRMPEMQLSIHVRIRKGVKVFWLFVINFCFIKSFISTTFLHFVLYFF